MHRVVLLNIQPRLLQILCACCTTSFQRYGKKISEIENVVINGFKILKINCIYRLFSVN